MKFTLMTNGHRLADFIGGPYDYMGFLDAQHNCAIQATQRGVSVSIWHLDDDGFPSKPVAGFNTVFIPKEGWL